MTCRMASHSAGPSESPGLQPTGTKPYPHAVMDQHLEPVGAVVGKHVTLVRLRATCKAALHLHEQSVDAPRRSLAPSASQTASMRITG